MYQTEAGVLKLAPRYEVISLNKDDFSVERTNDERWEVVKEIFPNGKADSMNILMGAASSIKLNSIRKLDNQLFQVIVIHPRLHVLKHADLHICSEDDILWLRKVIQSSVDAFADSQRYNIESRRR